MLATTLEKNTTYICITSVGEFRMYFGQDHLTAEP